MASENVVSALQVEPTKRFVTLTGSAAFLPVETPNLIQK